MDYGLNEDLFLWRIDIKKLSNTPTNNQSRVVEFDVTSDVANFLKSTNQNYGWIIKKTEEGQNGQISFGTKESSSVPQLVVAAINRNSTHIPHPLRSLTVDTY
jgi:hypothetical protein